MNTKSEIGDMNAQLRGELLKEHGDMDYETPDRSVDERADALDERADALDERAEALDERDDALERDGDETERPPFGCAPACILARAAELNEGDLLIINDGLVVLSRQYEDSTVHIKSRADGIDIDVRRLDNVEPQPLNPHSQPTSKTSEENAAAKENPQSGNGVKDRIWGLIGKIHVVVQTVSNSIKIWESFQAVSLIGLGMFGGS